MVWIYFLPEHFIYSNNKSEQTRGFAHFNTFEGVFLFKKVYFHSVKFSLITRSKPISRIRNLTDRDAIFIRDISTHTPVVRNFKALASIGACVSVWWYWAYTAV